MDELISLRDLIMNEGPRNRKGGIAQVFRKLRSDTLPDRIVTRRSYPYPPTGLMMALDILGLRSTYACSHSAPDVHLFSTRYISRRNVWLHINVSPSKSDTVRGALARVFFTHLGHTRDHKVIRPEISYR